MRYNTIKYNDIANSPGIAISMYLQGCPHHCPECFNKETWDFDGGQEFKPELLDTIIDKLNENGIKRSFCLLGGEPLCNENLFLSYLLIQTIKEKSPSTPIYIWTGYLYEDLTKRHDPKLDWILSNADYLIDGPFIEEEKDLTLSMRGSKNQRIINLKILHN